MDDNSALSTSDFGQYSTGAGAKPYFGGSYAGQGGVGVDRYGEPPEQIQLTHGSFSQEPDNSKFHEEQMGSAGLKGNMRGGGVIVIKMNSGEIHGRLEANGQPAGPPVGEKYYEAASGGYIFVN